MIPNTYHLQFKKEQIAEKVKEIADAVQQWVEQEVAVSGQDVIAVPLLKGGIFFYADLSRAIQHSLALFPLKASAYAGNETALEAVKMDFDFESVRGRSVLLVDEICESGRSLSAVTERCRQSGVKNVAQVVLILREGVGTFAPTFVGYRYSGPEWFVGYGMDDNGRYRNLPEIYTIGRK